MSMSGTRILIAIFSRRGDNYVAGKVVNLPIGNTEVAAEFIKELTGAALFKIETVKDYPSDYYETTGVAKVEFQQDARPALKGSPGDLGDFGVVFLGYPNWWDTMPMAVGTFLESHDFSGKTILPFCTHEGSGMGHSERDIRRLCPRAKVLKGLPIKGSTVQKAEKAIAAWLRESGVID